MRKTTVGSAFAAVAVLVGANAVFGGTQLLFGQRLIIKNALPDDEAMNRVVFTGKGMIAAPPLGSAGDPTCAGEGGGGGSLTVTAEFSGTTLTVPLPCENWSVRRRGGGYEYSDRELDDAPCRRVDVRDGKAVRAVCLGRGPSTLDFDLALGQHQSPVDVTLRLGSDPERYCLSFGGRVRKNGTDGKTFLASKAPAPVVACSPSGAFIDGPVVY